MATGTWKAVSLHVDPTSYTRNSGIYNKLSCVLTFVTVVCRQESQIEYIVPMICDIDDVLQWTFDLISRTFMCTGGSVLFMAVLINSVA